MYETSAEVGSAGRQMDTVLLPLASLIHLELWLGFMRWCMFFCLLLNAVHIHHFKPRPLTSNEILIISQLLQVLHVCVLIFTVQNVHLCLST